MKIYNIIGQEVVSLKEATMDAGSYKLQWRGTDQAGKVLGSGIYFVKLSAFSTDGKANFAQTRKLLLMK
jgi:flagellar hook assembly protein FlgD